VNFLLKFSLLAVGLKQSLFPLMAFYNKQKKLEVRGLVKQLKTSFLKTRKTPLFTPILEEKAVLINP
jgi:hypothetical protein